MTASPHFAKHSKNQFVNSNEVNTEIKAFAKMQRLKLLQLDYVKLRGGFKDFPQGLIWLRWHGFPLQSFPRDFNIKRLVALDMRNSSLKYVWNDMECLPNLKILNLNHSLDLLKTPNFSGLPSLERLMLKDCIKLIEVDQSIGELKSLTFLSLKDCKNLMKLPRTIGSLLSLEELILSGCSRLDDVPMELHNMKSLKVINLDETAIYESRSWLSWLSLKRGKELGFFWASLPCSLVKLSVENCKLSDDVMPNDLGNLPYLKSLNLSRNPIHSLPESISCLTKLDELLLISCIKLQVIPKLPIINPFIEVYLGLSPLTVGLSSIPCLISLKRCIIFGCENLIEVEGVFKMEPIANLEVKQIKSLFNIDFIASNKVQLFNYLIDKKIVVMPQVLQECGITSTFLPGTEVPIWFEHRTKGHQVSFTLPVPSSGERINCFTFCIVFSIDSDQIFEHIPCLYLINETKEIMRAYFSSFIGIPETNNNTMLWLIHWPAMGFHLEGGDSIICRVVPKYLNIRDFGITCGSKTTSRYESTFGRYYPGNGVHVTRNIELKLTKELINLGSSEVLIYNHSEESKTVASPQVLYDCGIISEFNTSKEVPLHHYGHHDLTSKISFTVPPNCSRKMNFMLKLIIILLVNNDKTIDFFPRVEIENETKGIKWSHAKPFVGIPEAKNTKISWLSCWKFKEELEAGDRVSLTVISDLHLVENGINFLYNYELIDGENFFDPDLLSVNKCFNPFVANVLYFMFKSHKTSYRMSLVKE